MSPRSDRNLRAGPQTHSRAAGKNSRLLSSDTETWATKAEREMSPIKKKSFPASVEKREQPPRSSHATMLPFGVDVIGAKCIFMK